MLRKGNVVQAREKSEDSDRCFAGRYDPKWGQQPNSERKGCMPVSCSFHIAYFPSSVFLCCGFYAEAKYVVLHFD